MNEEQEATDEWLAGTMHTEPDEYPGFEEYGVPTQAQIDDYLAKEAARREREAWEREHPIYTCRDESKGWHFSLNDFDAVLRETYAPGIRQALMHSNSLMSMVGRPARRRRFWYKPWTWLRKNVKPVAGSLKSEEEYMGPLRWAPTNQLVNVVTDPYCPPGQVFLIDTERLIIEPPDWSWLDDATDDELLHGPYGRLVSRPMDWFHDHFHWHHDDEGNELGGEG